MLMNLGEGVMMMSGDGDGGSNSPPSPAPQQSSGVIVQIGPGSNNSSTSTTPSSLHLSPLHLSPVVTPPAPAPYSSTASSNFHNLFGVHCSNPLSFPAFSSNVTLTSNHVRTGSQDAAFVPNSPSTNITLPVFVPTHHNHNRTGGIAPLAVLSSPSLGSSPTNSPTSPTSGIANIGNHNGTVSIDIPTAALANSGTSSSSLLSPSTTLPCSASSFVISTNNNTSNSSVSAGSSSLLTTNTNNFSVNNQSSGHTNIINAIAPGACSLNQSIAAGGIAGVGSLLSTSSSTSQPQHCLLVSCNNPNSNSTTTTNLVSTEAQTDNNNDQSESKQNTTIAIAPPPPSRSREHRKRERRDKSRRDRSSRQSTSSSSANHSHHHNSRSGGQSHHHNSSAVSNVSSSCNHSTSNHHHNSGGGNGGGSNSGGTVGSRHRRHHYNHNNRIKNCDGGSTSSSFRNANANGSSGGGGSGVQESNLNSNNSNFISSPYGNSSARQLCATNASSSSCRGGDGDHSVNISEVQSQSSERGAIVIDDRICSVVSPLPSELGGISLGPPPGSPLAGIGMPDILDSHLPHSPPPYSTLPHGSGPPVPPHPPIAMGPTPVPIPLIPSPVPLIPAPPPPTLISPANCIPAQPVRYHFTTAARASRRSMRAHRGIAYASEEEPKTCCGMSASQAVSIRWFIIVIAVIGICCTLAGTALGAARSAGKEHLTLSLLMIGVGVLLLTVSAVAWRLTANESGSSCRAMLGFARSGSSRGDGGAEPNRRFVPRLPPTYGRPHHPYAAMMYPEFQYRQPPPSYQASMQEYRLRLLLLERSNPTIAALGTSAMGHGPVTMLPPPPYRPYSANMRMLQHAHRIEDYSRPPSYRSRTSGNPGDYGTDGSPGSRPSLDPSVGHNHHHHSHHPHHHLNHHHIIESPMHSRDPSLLSYLSQQSVDNISVVSGHGNPTATATVVTVVQAVSVGMDIGLGSTLGPPYDADEDGKGLPSLEAVDDKSSYDPEERDNKDGNLVRIVQTTDSSQVIGRESVIVTVSGGSGSNGSLWDTYHHHHTTSGVPTYTVTSTDTSNNLANSAGSGNNIITTTNNNGIATSEMVVASRDQNGLVGGSGSSGGGNGGSEVQILAHL